MRHIALTAITMLVACARAAERNDVPSTPLSPVLGPPGDTGSSPGTTPPSSGVAGVFASSSLGDEHADGSFSRPYRTLREAIAVAQRTHAKVIACAETFAERVVIDQGTIEVDGGYDCTSLAWRTTERTARIEAGGGPALRVTNAQSVSLVRVDVNALDVGSDEKPELATSVAIEVRKTQYMHITHSRIHAGRGRMGRDASAPPPLLLLAGEGAAGVDAVLCGSLLAPCISAMGVAYVNAGGDGARGQCVEERDYAATTWLPARGGNGGDGGYYNGTVNATRWGEVASPGQPLLAMAGTSRGGAVAGSGALASAGAVGHDGANGVSGITVVGYARGDSTMGRVGGVGESGGGGGGSERNTRTLDCPIGAPCPAFPPNTSWLTASGGGGGAGGCPGRPAAPAEGGGASIAMFIEASDVQLEGVVLETTGGGQGGAGGFGSAPTDGGAGGAAPRLGFAGAGARGGRGGSAGYTGHGANGASYGIAYLGGLPRMTGVTFALGPPGLHRDALADAPTASTRVVPASVDGERAEVRLVLDGR